MRYSVVVCDAPWSFSDRLEKMKKPVKRSAVSQYNVMTSTQIAALDVKSIVDPSYCLLALWVPSVLLPQGLEVMSSWGFTFKQTLIWVKVKKNLTSVIKMSLAKDSQVDANNFTSFGMGRLFRSSHEVVLIGTSGKVYPHLQNHSQRSVIFDENQGHSIKPEALQDRLDLMFPTQNRLEMFARRQRPGWTCVGDAIDGQDIRQAIQALQTLQIPKV